MTRSDMVVELLEDFGYEAARFSLSWVSSAEPDKFVEAVIDMTKQIRQLGPVNGADAEAI